MKRFEKVDLGDSFEKLKGHRPTSHINVNGIDVEILPGQRAKWGKFTGTFPEVAQKVREAGMALNDSIKK